MNIQILPNITKKCASSRGFPACLVSPIKPPAAWAAAHMAPCIYLCPVIRERRLGLCQQRPTCLSVLTRPAYLLLPEHSCHSSVQKWLGCFFFLNLSSSSLHRLSIIRLMWKPRCCRVVDLRWHRLLPTSRFDHFWYPLWRLCFLLEKRQR